MSYKTWRKREEEKIKKAYFQYWLFQNNPDYIEFYINNFTPQRLNNERYSSWARRLGREQEMESTVHPQLLQKFKLSHPFPVDPFKKIDWSNFKKILLEPDREILKTFDRFQRNGGGAVVTISPRAFEYAPFAVSEALRGLSHYKYPFCFIPNIVDYDKEEIFEQIAQQIDSWRKIETIKKLRHRDHINKFHLYTQVWEWRKDRIPFSKMPGTEATNISRYRKAGKLLGYPGTAHEGDRKVCDNCDERASGCKIPCPDLLFHLAKVENKRKEKLSPHYNLIMDKQVHADWLQKELENH